MSVARAVYRVARRNVGWLGRRTRKRLGAWYYAYLFDRPLPFAEAAGRVVRRWERRDRRGDVPQDQATWDRQYAEGRWAFMAEPREMARYDAVIDMLTAYAPGGAVLDVGCGEGLLFRRFRSRGYSRYVGVDLSATAIARLASEEDATTSFVCADADSYTPAGPFDAIVFNESLYYLQQPFAAVERSMAALRPEGVVIVSTLVNSPRAMAILRGLKWRLSLKEEVLIRRGEVGCLCNVFARRGREGQCMSST